MGVEHRREADDRSRGVSPGRRIHQGFSVSMRSQDGFPGERAGSAAFKGEDREDGGSGCGRRTRDGPGNPEPIAGREVWGR